MTGHSNHDQKHWPRPISRRAFIKLAAMVGLLAGCRPVEQAVITATPAPTTPAEALTSLQDAPGRVVQAQHSTAWSDGTLDPEAIGQMLDAAISRLTGLGDASSAWSALFAADERIAIKVNTCADEGCDFFTHVPLVSAVTERLQQAGVPPEQIVIFDRRTGELENAGYTINPDGPGVRCFGTDGEFTSGWTLVNANISLSDILLNSDALINIPILKTHPYTDVTFAMKNHYGTFNRPQNFHLPEIDTALPELNALAPIRERTRLIIGDALSLVQPSWHEVWRGDSILMSYDPVAHDRIGLQLLSEAIATLDTVYMGFGRRAGVWMQNAADMGLGTNDPSEIEWVRLSAG